MNQIGIPVEASVSEVKRLKSLGAAIELSASVAGYSLDKQLQESIKVDKAQFSRWKSGGEGIKEDKLQALRDFCGNDIVLFYLCESCGYDYTSLRKTEGEMERMLRESEEARAEQAREIAILRSLHK